MAPCLTRALPQFGLAILLWTLSLNSAVASPIDWMNPAAAVVTDINNNGLVIGQTVNGSFTAQSVLFNMKTNELTELSRILPQLSNIHAIALDDKGEVLVTDDRDHSLLLVPTGVSPQPVPEPSALITIALGLGAWRLSHGRRRRLNG